MVEVGIILAEDLPDLEEEAVVVDSEGVLVVLVAVVLAVAVPEVVGNLSDYLFACPLRLTPKKWL